MRFLVGTQPIKVVFASKTKFLRFCLEEQLFPRFTKPNSKRLTLVLFSLFQYICYPWKDDSGVPASEKRDLCRKKSDCSAKRGQTCQRHQDRRKINKGLCMNEVRNINAKCNF